MSPPYPSASLRVSDNEREPVIDRLKDAYAEGRLEYHEFESRLQLTMLARTRGDLAAITADLHPRPRRVVPTAVLGASRCGASTARTGCWARSPTEP